MYTLCAQVRDFYLLSLFLPFSLTRPHPLPRLDGNNPTPPQLS